MRPVLVETNWVVDVCAPPYRRESSALALLSRAEAGELKVHVPAVALREAADVIRRKHQPSQAKVLQMFRRWAVENGQLDSAEAGAVRVFLDKFANHTRSAIDSIDIRLDEVASSPGVEVFALSQTMLERAISLRKQVHDLKPFDEALLAAVLVRAESLRGLDPVFCTLDADLVPFNKRGQPRTELDLLYSTAGLTVRKDFLIPAS